MDPITCIKSSTRPHCASAGQLMASIVDRKVWNATYREVYDFYYLNGCLEPGTSISRVVGFYDEWVANVTGTKIKNLHDIIVGESDCRLQFCKNLNFTGNADFAGIGVSKRASYSGTYRYEPMLTLIIGSDFLLHPDLHRHSLRHLCPVPHLQQEDSRHTLGVIP
jgi:hypothetical protein